MESLSRPPHRRKHSSTSFSIKNPYDDVFLSNRGQRDSLEAHEYAEIFAGSSSIPVIDLSGLDERLGPGDCRSSKLDYSNIFGGFGNDDVAVPYEDLLNGGSAKKNKMRNPTDTRESGSLPSSVKPKIFPSETSDKSVDGVKKQFNVSFNKTSQKNTDASNGKTHVAQLKAVSGFAYFVDGTPRKHNTEDGKTGNPSRRDVSRTWSFSTEVETVKDKGVLNYKASHNETEVNLKSNFTKMPPFFVAEKDTPEDNAGEFSPPHFSENFDENSVAAASAAALKKAIDQAQESIRLAKMIMDRKMEGSKPRERGRLEVSDKKGKSDRGSYGSKMKNSKEIFRESDPAFSIRNEIDRKLTPSPSHDNVFPNTAKIEVERVCENIEAAKEHENIFAEDDQKVELEKSGENVEETEADFPLLIADPYKIENLMVSDNSDEREAIVYQTKGPEVVGERIERPLNTSRRMNLEEAEQCRASFDDARGLEQNQLEKFLVNPQITRAQEKIMSESGENFGVSQENEACQERESDVDDKGNQEPGAGSKLYNVLHDSFNLGDNGTPGQVATENESEIVREKKENGHVGDIFEEDEGHLFFESEEQLKESPDGEIYETQNRKQNHAQLENNNKIEERHTNTPEMGAKNSSSESEARSSAVFCDSQEINCTIGGESRNEENRNDCQYEENADGAVNVDIISDAQTDNTSTVINETREACGIGSDNKSEEYQSGVKNSNENGTASEAFETVCVIDKGKEPETLRRSASEEIVVESDLHDAFDSPPRDDVKSEHVHDTGLDPECELPEDQDTFYTTSEIHDVDQGCTSEINGRNLPQVDASDGREAEFSPTDVSHEYEQTSESESEECRENTNDVRPNSEELTDELELASNERKSTEEQSEPKITGEVKPTETERSVEKDIKPENNNEILAGNSTVEEKETTRDKTDYQQRIEAIKRGREREKDRIVVDRAIREARERAFAEARERAERAAVERAASEARQRAMAEAREKLDKASLEAKRKSERAAVERATTEARERALEKAMSQKITQTEGKITEKGSGSSRNNGLKHSLSSSDLESGTESAQRRKARLERHQRIMERASKALAEKNMRDLLAQKEQAERNRIADSLDADIKRWATGKEGNMRALLSTLQYILGPGSGWQPIPLTEIVTTAAVKKAYRKATLYVHPDKLQQRGASIQQKYLCEKIFDLLKAAWNRFNSDER